MLEVRPGRWRMRNGNTVTVEDRDGDPYHPWRGRDDKGWRFSWKDNGAWHDNATPQLFDLIEYLGPEEPAGGEA